MNRQELCLFFSCILVVASCTCAAPASSSASSIFSLLQSQQDYTLTVESMTLTGLENLYSNSSLLATFFAANDTAWNSSTANVTGAITAAKLNETGALAFLTRLLAANTVNTTVKFSSLSSNETTVTTLAGLGINFTKSSSGDAIGGDPVISPDVTAGAAVVQFVEFLLVPPAPNVSNTSSTAAPTSVATAAPTAVASR
eukprot:jgi/Galph1/5326/GphlegSOOS_G3906.1